MFQRFLLTLVLALITSTCIASQSSTHRIVVYDADTDQNAPIVLQGDVIQFHGAVPQQGTVTHLELRNGGRILDQGNFRDEWRLRFDTQATDRDDYLLTLYIGSASSQHRILRRIPVTVTTTAPFDWDLPQRPAPGQNPRIAQVRVTGSTQLKQVRTELTVDDQPLRCTQDGSGALSLAPDENQRGLHELGGRVIVEGAREYILPPLLAYIVGKIDLIGFPFGNKLDLAMCNGNLPVSAVIASEMQPARVTYRLDGETIAERTSAPFDTITWNPAHTRIGSHTLMVEATDASGTLSRSPVYSFTVSRSDQKIPPREFAPAQPAEDEVGLPLAEGVGIVAPDPGSLLAPVTLKLQSGPNFQADSVVYTINRHTMPANPTDPMTAYWDVRSEYPGEYDISAVATSTDGHRFRVPGITVHVAPRVTLTCPTGVIHVDQAHPAINVSIQCVEGVHPQTVFYRVDGNEVARKTAAPFETATLNLSDVESGRHIVTAWVVNDDAAYYVTPNVTIEVRNPTLDAEWARKLKEMQRIRR